MNYLQLACEKLGITPEQVLSHRVYETEIVLVVNEGIAGCPKRRIPLSELQEPASVKPRRGRK